MTMYKLSVSLAFAVVVVASTAACTSETATDAPDELTDTLASDTVDPQGVGPCTSGGVVISCTDPICSLPNSTLGRGPAVGYYPRERCEAYAAACGKSVIAYVSRYVTSSFIHTSCYFR